MQDSSFIAHSRRGKCYCIVFPFKTKNSLKWNEKRIINSRGYAGWFIDKVAIEQEDYLTLISKSKKLMLLQSLMELDELEDTEGKDLVGFNLINNPLSYKINYCIIIPYMLLSDLRDGRNTIERHAYGRNAKLNGMFNEVVIEQEDYKRLFSKSKKLGYYDCKEVKSKNETDT